MSVNSELKATKIISQRKAFYRQRIPEFSCARIVGKSLWNLPLSKDLMRNYQALTVDKFDLYTFFFHL